MPVGIHSQRKETPMSTNIDDLYPSRFLKSGDLNGPMRLTIASIKQTELGNEPKVIITFSDNDKAFVLNKTNKNLIKKLYGSDYSKWIGRPITLVATEVDFKGDMVSAIRVKVTKAPTKQEPPPPESADEFNDEIDPL
jgi:hypothetical protein